MAQEETQKETEPRIRRARVDSLCIYEVTEDELETLEKGSPGSLQLNFAIFFLSTGTAFLVSLLTTPITSNHIFIVFVVVTAIGLAFGVFLLILWYDIFRSTGSVSKKVRNRLEEETALSQHEIDISDSNSTQT